MENLSQEQKNLQKQENPQEQNSLQKQENPQEQNNPQERESLLQERENRVETAATMGIPDTVPWVPMVSGFYMLGYQVSFYDFMKDPRTVKEGVRRFCREYEPDAGSLPGFYNMDSLEALDTTFLRWPGPECGVPLDVSFQHIDMEALMEDEYDEFIEDPTHTILTKILPRKHKKLKGLSKLDFHEVYDKSMIDSFAAFTDPEVWEAVEAMKKAGEACNRFRMRMGEVMSILPEGSVPHFVHGGLTIPFDAFADSCRGIINTSMDLLTCPEDVERAVGALTRFTVEKAIRAAAARGAKRIIMPLHMGVDEFMSPANYEKYYWPNLKYCINTIIRHGMTPVAFCEGHYDSRLKVLCDVPKGKVIYMFENVDLKRMKETVGQVACVAGTVPNALLAYGKPEQVEAETKRQIDILAPGGGFIMNCSAMLDNADHKNMHIWRDVTREYGRSR